MMWCKHLYFLLSVLSPFPGRGRRKGYHLKLTVLSSSLTRGKISKMLD